MTKPGSASPLSVLLWAVYLASSWTWCIGLFMPTLMVRDYGWAAFLVFLIPNALGAGLMGFVLSTQSASERFAKTHAPALRLFALITLLFQGFFVGWMTSRFGPQHQPIVLGAFATTLVLSAFFARTKAALALALGAMGVTIAAYAALANLGKLTYTGDTPALADTDLFFLAPVVLFGFALCPYLDPTFHRARRALPGRAGSAAFGIGFWLVFLIPIVLTFASRDVIRLWGAGASLTAALWIAVHTAVQLGFTTGIHGRELAPDPSGDGPSKKAPAIGLPFAALGLAIGLGFAPIDLAGLDPRELVYRAFMVFYGLLFPAYVWILAIPTADGHAGTAGPQGRRKLRALMIATLLSIPCYTIGYLWRHELWMLPGLAALIAARFFVRSSRPA